jgi:hypothetical protein
MSMMAAATFVVPCFFQDNMRWYPAFGRKAHVLGASQALQVDKNI